MARDYYALLGVAKDADDAALKKAYRKMAMRWHPDKNKGSAEAEKKFKDIALCSLFYFSSKEKEGKKRDGEYSSKKSISKNESVRLRARVGSAPIRRPTLRPIEMERRKKRFRALLSHLSRRIIFGTDATTGASLAPQMPSKGRENNI